MRKYGRQDRMEMRVEVEVPADDSVGMMMMKCLVVGGAMRVS